MRVVSVVAAAAFGLLGCSGHQTRSYENIGDRHVTTPDQVMVLMSNPDRAFVKLGAVSVKRWKPGFTDPSIVDAEGQLKAAGAELGADAVVVHSSHAEARIVYVDGEAIRYTK